MVSAGEEVEERPIHEGRADAAAVSVLIGCVEMIPNLHAFVFFPVGSRAWPRRITAVSHGYSATHFQGRRRMHRRGGGMALPCVPCL